MNSGLITELLVPLDGSLEARAALIVAANIAAQWGAAVSVVTVCSPNGVTWSSAAWQEESADAAGIELRRRLDIPSLDVASTIIEAAIQPGTLLCMTSHGRSGFTQALLGSTSAEVIRSSQKPVLLVGPRSGPCAEITSILACLDGSDFSERGAYVAADWAERLGAELRLAEVGVPGAEVPPDVVESATLVAIADRLGTGGSPVNWEYLHDPHPADALCRHADDADVDLIVIASHGRSGVRSVALGSVAAGIVRHAHQPVLVLGPKTTGNP